MLYFVLTLLYACHSGRTKIISGLEGKPLPSFNMLLTDSISNLNSSRIPAGRPIVLFYFSPYCPYCKAETEEIMEKVMLLKNIQFYFISPYPITPIKDFDKRFGLSKHENFIVAQITDTSFSKYYTIPGVPYMAIYDDRKILREVLLGKHNVDDIKEITTNN
jgi:thiol-disulfide isomerase/thioredoxin